MHQQDCAWAGPGPSAHEQVSLNITSTNIVSNFSANPTGEDLILFVQQAIAINGAQNVSARYVQGNQSLTQNVSIATQFCVPSNYSYIDLARTALTLPSGYNLSSVILAVRLALRDGTDGVRLTASFVDLDRSRLIVRASTTATGTA